ncbi:hypothetical protein L484_011932 [Morus notabilis]|uniref:Dirigent protein n=1 Tax=Morus notabilis TaxID=981085 RepID=W9QI17_9ROSA|nr:dirigent protein 23 [Morus notabilis]EXB37871.1 hypothetical protein L484_011932 [Morus notabilis]
MASNGPFSTPAKLFLLSLILAMLFMTRPSEAQTQRQNQTNLVLFFQDYASGRNATVVPVVGITGKTWSFVSFGTIFAIDDQVTQTPDKSSAQVGRAEGVLVTSALDGSNVSVLISIVFNNLEYSGSTLELQGVIRQNERYREVSVVSGTGRFRFARGYAIFETIYYDRATSNTIIRCTVTLG